MSTAEKMHKPITSFEDNLAPGDVLIKVVQLKNSGTSYGVCLIQGAVKLLHDIAVGLVNAPSAIMGEFTQLNPLSVNPMSGERVVPGGGVNVKATIDEAMGLSTPDRMGYNARCMHVAMYIGDGCVVEAGSGTHSGLGKLPVADSANLAFHVFRYTNHVVCAAAAYCIQLFMKNKWTSYYGASMNPRENRTGWFSAPILQRSELGPEGQQTREIRRELILELMKRRPDPSAIESKNSTAMICSEAVIAAYQAAKDVNDFAEDPIPLDASATSPMALCKYLKDAKDWSYVFSALWEKDHWTTGRGVKL